MVKKNIYKIISICKVNSILIVQNYLYKIISIFRVNSISIYKFKFNYLSLLFQLCLGSKHLYKIISISWVNSISIYNFNYLILLSFQLSLGSIHLCIGVYIPKPTYHHFGLNKYALCNEHID